MKTLLLVLALAVSASAQAKELHEASFEGLPDGSVRIVLSSVDTLSATEWANLDSLNLIIPMASCSMYFYQDTTAIYQRGYAAGQNSLDLVCPVVIFVLLVIGIFIGWIMRKDFEIRKENDETT